MGTCPKMIRQVTFVALTFFSFSEAFRGTVKLGHKISQPPTPLRSDDYPEQFHDQILDHFDATNPGQWNQRYWANFDNYDNDGLAFLFIGGESEASPGWLNYGKWYDWAQMHGAALFVLEHRFYGQSHPTEDMSRDNMVYLSSRQGLEDAGNFISTMNSKHNLTTWMTFGGSYPGSLSAWMRLRFPHLVAGSVSSSGPLFAKLDYFEYLQVVMDALDWTGNTDCNPAWNAALTKVEEMVTMEDQWAGLTEKFKLCSSLDGSNSNDVKSFLELLIDNLAGVVQYNGRYPVDMVEVCRVMTDETLGEPLDRLAVVNDMMLEMNGEECLDHTYATFLADITQTEWATDGSFVWRPWLWQTCTEFGWYQTTNQESQTYGTSLPLEFFEQWCADAFGAEFTHDMLERSIAQTNVEYGGFTPSLSNVVFVHGSVDPWHAMGVLESLTDDAPAIYITGTSHCADMYPDKDTDPEGLTQARVMIGEEITKWVCQHYEC